MQQLKNMLEAYRRGERDLPSYAELAKLAENPAPVDAVSMRDQFAMRAPAMPTDFDRVGRKVEKVITTPTGGHKLATVTEWESPAQHAARWAYEFADAMLAARGEQ